MALGRGKYDAEAEAILLTHHAKVALVIVIGGDKGEGFSLTADVRALGVLKKLPELLRIVAEQVEEDMKGH